MFTPPLRSLAVAAGLLAFAVPATAATTFAQFKEVDTSVKSLGYTYHAKEGSYTMLAGPVAVNLTGYDLGFIGDTATSFYLEATSTNNPFQMPESLIVGQAGFSGTLTFADYDPEGNVTTNYLTLAFDDAFLGTGVEATNGTFQSIGELTYSSDIFDLTRVGEVSFALSLSGFSQPFRMQQNFTSNVTGTFDATLVPESATWMMMIAGFGMVGAGIRRRRNRVAVHAA